MEETKEALQELQNVSQKFVYQNKNEVPSQIIQVEGPEIELVEIHIYIGHEIKINKDNQTCELLRRITLEWTAYGRSQDIFKTDMPISLKSKAFNQCVLPVLTYGAETLTFTKTSAKKLQIS